MASQWIFLERNADPAKLNSPLYPGSSVYFVSTSFDQNPDPSAVLDNTSVNLENGQDILLHISIRRVAGVIVLDTRRGNTWDEKLQEISLKDVFPGPGAIIKVTVTNTAFDIAFNNSPNIHSFPKRINAIATAVSYNENKQRPAFSNPIAAGIFNQGVFISPSPPY